MSTRGSSSRVKRPARAASYVHRAGEEMSNDVAAAQNPDNQSKLDERIFQTSISVTISFLLMD